MKVEISEELLLEMAAPPSETILVDTNRGVIYSPLGLCRSQLCSYVNLFFWRFPGRSRSFKMLSEELKALNRFNNMPANYSDLTEDEIPELTLKLRRDFVAFQQDFTGHNGDYSRDDRRFFLGVLDQLMADEERIRERRHQLSELIQRHFYFSVAVPWQGLYELTQKGNLLRGEVDLPRVFREAAAARDSFYLNEKNSQAAYFEAVEVVTKSSAYQKWLDSAERGGIIGEVKNPEEIGSLKDELEVNLLWNSATAV